MVQAWHLDEAAGDPRRPVGLEQLRRLGVLYWKVPARGAAGARGAGG